MSDFPATFRRRSPFSLSSHLSPLSSHLSPLPRSPPIATHPPCPPLPLPRLPCKRFLTEAHSVVLSPLEPPRSAQ